MKWIPQLLWVGVLLGGGTAGIPARAQHAGDILVGRTADMKLAATGLPARTLFLAPVSSGSFQGWSGTTLGFDAVIGSAPLDGVLPLAPGANVHLEVVSMDPGLSLRSFTAPAQVYADEPGERLRIGSSGNLRYHPIVFIDGAQVGSDFTGLRRARFRMVDLGSGGHLASPDYLLTFAPLNTRLEFRRAGKDLEISFLAHSGLAYRIEFAADAIGPWSALSDPILGADRLLSILIRPASDQRIFRALAFIDN